MSFALIADYAVVANVQAGSNGSAQGAPELTVGATADDQVAGRVMWDPDLSDGLDSGWRTVGLTVVISGGVTTVNWSIGNSTVGVAYSRVSDDAEVIGFAVRAGVTGADDSVAFRNISAQFFRSATATVPAETDEVDDVAASTLGVDAADTESMVEIGPDGTGFHKAVFSAQVQLESSALPDPCELFGQVFVFAKGA